MHPCRRITRKGSLSCGHFIKHQAKREQVGARIQLLATNLFWRHVGRGSHPLSCYGQPQCRWRRVLTCRDCGVVQWLGGACEFSHTKIQNLGLSALRDEDVRGFNVSMNDALTMSRILAFRDLNGKID